MCDVPFGPVIVAKQSYLSQTASLPMTTIYTPAVDGDYIVVVYPTFTVPSVGAVFLNLTLQWTDELGVKSSGVPNNSQTTIRAVANQPIQLGAVWAEYTGSGGTSPGMYFDVFVTVVKT